MGDDQRPTEGDSGGLGLVAESGARTQRQCATVHGGATPSLHPPPQEIC